MAMTVSGAGVKNPNAGILVDMWESWDGYNSGSATTPQADQRGTNFGASSGGTIIGQIFSAVSGVLAMVWYNAPGRWLIDYVSAAGRVVRIGGTLQMPAGTRFADAESLPIPYMRPLRRYTLSVPVRSAVAGTSAVEVGIATTNGGLTMLGTTQAFVWSSDPARSAGAWEPRYRRTNAGAIVNGTVTTTIPIATRFDLLGIRYTEGAIPKIEWLLNGVPVYEISGDALMPVISAIGSPLVPFCGINGPIGRTLSAAPARYVVEEI